VPDVYIILDLPVNDCRERILKRFRSFETEKCIEELQMNLKMQQQTLFKILGKKYIRIKISRDMTEKNVLDLVVKEILNVQL